MEIKARRLLAVEYRCPQCQHHSASLAMAPTKRNRDYIPTCITCDCEEVILARRYYTQFAADFSSTAGTLGTLGPFQVCTYVFPTIRAFRKFVAERQAQIAKEAEAYYARQRELQAEAEARLKRQREEAALVQEAEQIAWRRQHAAELEAEQIARAVWPEDNGKSQQTRGENLSKFDDDHPF
jgi:hypothetical protein